MEIFVSTTTSDAWHSRWLTVRQLLGYRVCFWLLSTFTLVTRVAWEPDSIVYMFRYVTVWWNVVAWLAVSVSLVDYSLRPATANAYHSPPIGATRAATMAPSRGRLHSGHRGAACGRWVVWERWSEWLLVGHWTAALIVGTFFWGAVLMSLVGSESSSALPDWDCSGSRVTCWHSGVVTTCEHLFLPLFFLTQPLFSHLTLSVGSMRCTIWFSLLYFIWSLYLAKAHQVNVYEPYLDLTSGADVWCALLLWGCNILLNCAGFWVGQWILVREPCALCCCCAAPRRRGAAQPATTHPTDLKRQHQPPLYSTAATPSGTYSL